MIFDEVHKPPATFIEFLKNSQKKLIPRDVRG